MVWSRGHSVENYLFDFRCFAEKAKEYLPAEFLSTAVQLFQQVFQDAVRVACALGLAGYHHPTQNLKVMSRAVDWHCLSMDGGRLVLDLERWKQELAQKHMASDWINEGEKQYLKWWVIVSSADYQVVRWLCHGHVGIAAVWAAFARCVYQACSTLTPVERDNLAKAAATANKQIRFRGVVEQWTQQALKSHLECPNVIFRMLGLPA